MQRHAISAAFKLCGHEILENKTVNFSEWKAILKNKIAKILKIVQLRKLRTSKICMYTVYFLSNSAVYLSTLCMDDTLAVLCAERVATSLLTNVKCEIWSVDAYATIIPQCRTFISLIKTTRRLYMWPDLQESHMLVQANFFTTECIIHNGWNIYEI